MILRLLAALAILAAPGSFASSPLIVEPPAAAKPAEKPRWMMTIITFVPSPRGPVATSISTTITKDEAECDSAMTAANKVTTALELRAIIACSELKPVPRILREGEKPV